MITLKEGPRILCPRGTLRIKVWPVVTLKEGPRTLCPRGTLRIKVWPVVTLFLCTQHRYDAVQYFAASTVKVVFVVGVVLVVEVVCVVGVCCSCCLLPSAQKKEARSRAFFISFKFSRYQYPSTHPWSLSLLLSWSLWQPVGPE